MLPSKLIKFRIKHSPHCKIGGSAAFQLQDTNRVHRTGDQGAAATAFYRDFNRVKQRRCQFSWVVRTRRPRHLDKAALCHCCASETKHTGRASPPPCSGLGSRGWPVRIRSPRGSHQPSEPVWLRTLPAQLGRPTQVKTVPRNSDFCLVKTQTLTHDSMPKSSPTQCTWNHFLQCARDREESCEQNTYTPCCLRKTGRMGIQKHKSVHVLQYGLEQICKLFVPVCVHA